MKNVVRVFGALGAYGLLTMIVAFIGTEHGTMAEWMAKLPLAAFIVACIFAVAAWYFVELVL